MKGCPSRKIRGMEAACLLGDVDGHIRNGGECYYRHPMCTFDEPCECIVECDWCADQLEIEHELLLKDGRIT